MIIRTVQRLQTERAGTNQTQLNLVWGVHIPALCRNRGDLLVLGDLFGCATSTPNAKFLCNLAILRGSCCHSLMRVRRTLADNRFWKSFELLLGSRAVERILVFAAANSSWAVYFQSVRRYPNVGLSSSSSKGCCTRSAS